MFFLAFHLIHLTTFQTLSKPLPDAFLTTLFLQVRLITLRTIKLHMTLFAGHFRSDPLGKIWTGLVSTATGRAVLSDTVMMSPVLRIVALLAMSTEITSVQERWNASHAMVVLLCFQESNHLRSLIILFVFKQDFPFKAFQDNQLVLWPKILLKLFQFFPTTSTFRYTNVLMQLFS